MKTSPKLLLSLAGLLLLAVPAVRAADDTTATPPPPAADQPKREHRGPGAMMEHVAKELGLTPDQQAKWKDIGQQEKTALDALRDDTSIARKDKRPKMQEIMKTYRDQRRAVLTPDQQTKFDDMVAKMAEHGPRGDKGPKKEKSD